MNDRHMVLFLIFFFGISMTSLTPRGGGTLLFSYICRLRSFFGGLKFEILIFLGVFRKLIFFGV